MNERRQERKLSNESFTCLYISHVSLPLSETPLHLVQKITAFKLRSARLLALLLCMNLAKVNLQKGVLCL